MGIEIVFPVVTDQPRQGHKVQAITLGKEPAVEPFA